MSFHQLNVVFSLGVPAGTMCMMEIPLLQLISSSSAAVGIAPRVLLLRLLGRLHCLLTQEKLGDGHLQRIPQILFYWRIFTIMSTTWKICRRAPYYQRPLTAHCTDIFNAIISFLLVERVQYIFLTSTILHSSVGFVLYASRNHNHDDDFQACRAIIFSGDALFILPKKFMKVKTLHSILNTNKSPLSLYPTETPLVDL